MKSLRQYARSILARLNPTKRRTLGEDHVLPVARLVELLEGEPSVHLRSLVFRDGNVSPLELLIIATLVADRAPRCIFEIGTFNGNTALQMAENAASDAEVITLDLPLESTATDRPIDEADLKYIQFEGRTTRRFVGKPSAGKIREVFGDSAHFDFRATLGKNQIDFAFIDGSHSYEYVKNDTLKIFEHLGANGIVLWHDYHPYWHGVCNFLNEFQKTHSLLHIEGTTLVYYRASNNSVRST